MLVTKVHVGRYIDEAKLRTLLARLFPFDGHEIHIRLGRFIITTPRALTSEEIDCCAQSAE